MKRIRIILILTLSILSCRMAAHAETLNMMTYNIKGSGMTPSRMDNIATVINSRNPDMVALQEINNRTTNGMKHDYLGDLAQATGMNSYFFALVGSYYGIGILSKTEPVSIQRQSFPFSDYSKDKENRGFIIAEFENLYFISTHYSLNADDRDTATAWVIDFASKCDKPVFVAGDFNAKPTYRAMVTFQNNGFEILSDTESYTYPAEGPTSCIDMFLAYSNDDTLEYTVTGSEVISAMPGLKMPDVSDHLPVCITLDRTVNSIESISARQDIEFRCDTYGFSLCNLQEPSGIAIYNLSGQLLDSMVATDQSHIDAPRNYHNGIYFVKVNNSYQNQTFKYIINH